MTAWIVVALTAALAQAPTRDGTLRVTVVDPSGAVLPDASVVLATDGKPSRTAAADQNGIATFTGLAPGRYTVEASFPGFETAQLRDVRVRAGENRQVLPLPLQKLETSVEVGVDRQQAASDRTQTFGTTLTREQLQALSDDPAQLQQQLEDMAGPGAVIRVDSFEGSALPPKAMIKSIRISRDQFAAEYHAAGGVTVDIVTQPGIGPKRYFTNIGNSNGALAARSPFTPVKGPQQQYNVQGGATGSLVKDKASFGIYTFAQHTYDTPAINLVSPAGTRSEIARLRALRDVVNVDANLDVAVTRDQLLRFGYTDNRVFGDNLGVGGYNQEDRAFSRDDYRRVFRVQQLSPLGRRAFMRSRLQLSSTGFAQRSASGATTIQVLDAFTTGGAQLAGGRRATAIDGAVDVDYVRGIHSIRFGGAFNRGWVSSDDTSNYLGTFTFDSLDAFEANQPRSFTKRVGDPNLRYGLMQAAVYAQDDLRLRKNLTLSPGVRVEHERHVSDGANLAPRVGVTWAPTPKSGTTLRASWGIFYDWLNATTYEQTLRVDGLRQRELNILDPSFPDPGSGGFVPPVNRYVLGADFRAPRTTRLSTGVDQQFGKSVRVAITYGYLRGDRLARGLNLNPPLDGFRPDPAFANIVEVQSDAQSRQHQWLVDATVNPGALLPVAASAPLVDWHRTTLFVNYAANAVRDDTDGPFNVPPTGSLADDWGRAANNVPLRLNVSFNNQVVRNVLMGWNVSLRSGDPYTIRTGADDNGDGIFNDRPAGIARNTLEMPAQVTVNLQLGYQFSFGHLATPLPPGIGVFGGGGAVTVRTVDVGTAHYRLGIMMFVQNLTNRPNYIGYSGVLTSPFFGRPTAVGGMRRVNIGISLNF